LIGLPPKQTNTRNSGGLLDDWAPTIANVGQAYRHKKKEVENTYSHNSQLEGG
jgi:hypothetical protein